jgi:hypothetical protein
MKSCTIFSHFIDLKAVYDRLVERFGESSVQIEGPPESWTKLTVTARRFLRKSTLTFNVLHLEDKDGQLQDMIFKMRHVFQTIPAENKEVQEKMLVAIDHIRLGIGVVSDRRVSDWEDAIFGSAKILRGMVFWNGSQMLNEKGHVILDFKGRTRVSEFKVEVSSELLDGMAPKSEESARRKEENEALLKELNIPINANLPSPADSQTARFRSLEEIADRALALCLVALKGEGLEQKVALQFQRQYEISDERLSPRERDFMALPDPEPEARGPYSWRYEALWIMLWALNYVPELPYPSEICDVRQSVLTVREAGSRDNFHSGAKLRSPEDILDQTDLTLRLHWACVDASLRGEQAPADLMHGVVYQRHHAFNWLIGYMGADWDDVPTHT